MEKPEVEKAANTEDAAQLTRNRSFKSKQLVRSQAIRESASPPRALSPRADGDEARDAGGSSHSDCSDMISDKKNSDREDCKKKQPVEIQITPGPWDLEEPTEQRQRTKRWLGQNHSESEKELLSKNPRVACVCGLCAACAHCRGRRRRHVCPTKQDSGIVCSDDCPDCSDTEQSGGPHNDSLRKSASSIDVDEQTTYCRCPERKEKPKTISLSRSDSDDKTEPTGPELVSFIKETLNKNARDRLTLLRIEKDLHGLVNDTGRCILRFPVMTSYGRMLVHRCAALFQLSHHLDPANKTCVLVSKSGTSGGRIPCTSFKEWCTINFPPSPQRHQPDTLAKSILKRDTHSLDEPGTGALAMNRSKSLEQREREYERVRRRIFSSDNCAQDESQWPWLSGPVKLLTPESGRNRLLKVQSLESSGPSQQSWRGGRGAVSKSHSFGGYGGAEHLPRVLSRQGDLASSSWRLSPSSSGYKTLSLRSTDSVTPSPTGGASPEPAAGCHSVGVGVGVGVVWCVTDLSAVPPGALCIHPQTGRPLTNPDGSIYHFDPANPPILHDTSISHQAEQKIDPINEKRRGRLEKQHSFIDSECECQPTEECRSKCCCECRRHENCQPKTTSEKETNTKPLQSPVKTQQDQATHIQQQELANHKPSYESPANQNAPSDNQQRPHEISTNVNSGIQENRGYELANQRPPSDVRSMKMTNQESPELQYSQVYAQAYRPEEVISPSQNQYMQPELTQLHNILAQHKVTPVAMADPNMRTMSLTNVMYPAAVPQAYPYLNQCRVDQQLQPMYQQMIQPPDEQKQMSASPHNNENTFRIDPSYPYAAVDYASNCGGCVDPGPMQPQHRSYSVPYSQVDVQQTVMPPAYPVGNVILPQPHMQPYPYQEGVQWAGVPPQVGAAPKLLVPDVYPILQYPPPYPHYLYPQVIPQPYPICQPVYPIIEKQPEPRRNSIPGQRQSKRNSITGSNRPTPLQTPPVDKKVPYDEKRDEIAIKIQQIKEQMAQMNTKDRDRREGDKDGYRYRKSDDWRVRNSGNGILGNYPVNNNYNGRAPGRSSNDDTQLSSAARAIVNSIRNMQAKNTYQPDARRHEARRRERDDRYERGTRESETHDAKHDSRRAMPALHYRPHYLLRQMSPGTWCRRSPGPVHPVLNPRRPHPDTRNGRR